jgi:hypothetical protein
MLDSRGPIRTETMSCPAAGLPAATALRSAAAVALRLQQRQATKVTEGQGWRGNLVKNWGDTGLVW